MIRAFQPEDRTKLEELNVANNLDPRCMPELTVLDTEGKEAPNPLLVLKTVYEADERVAMICFLKVTSELFFFIDHRVGTPELRWEWLQEFKEYVKQEAWKLGFDQMTAFVPTEIEESFSKRLLDLGFVKSPWQSYTLNLD